MSDGTGKEQLIELAAAWIMENSSAARFARVEIRGTTPLLQEGLLDSLGLVDLMAFIEKTTGRQIDLLELDDDEVMTLEALCRATSGDSHRTESAAE